MMVQMRNSIALRLIKMIVAATLGLAVPGAILGYRFYASQATSMAKKGTASLDKGDVDEAKQYVVRLQKKGYESAAHILRGKILLSQAKEKLEKAPLPIPYEGMQRASQMVLSAAGLTGYPVLLGGLGWLAPFQVQQIFPRQIPGADDLINALGEFTQVLDENPWAAEATVLASECLVRLREYRSAEWALTSLTNRQPDNLDAHRWLAAIYLDVNAGVPAITHLREWIRLDGKDPRPYRWLGLIFRDVEGGSQEAIEIYGKMLQLNLDSGERATAVKELAETQMALAKYEPAMHTLGLVPETFQDRPSFLLLRAECLVGLGKGDEAKPIVEEVLLKHPSLESALLSRAKIYIQDGQPREAITLLEKVVSLQPHNSKARESLMLAYRSLRDDRRAAEQKQVLESLLAAQKLLHELKEEVASNPWNGRARLEMALLSSPFNLSEAQASIRFALASTPHDRKIRKTWMELFGYLPPPTLRDLQARRQRSATTG
jgi:tetratricopeptide (TPR) repeat protein